MTPWTRPKPEIHSNVFPRLLAKEEQTGSSDRCLPLFKRVEPKKRLRLGVLAGVLHCIRSKMRSQKGVRLENLQEAFHIHLRSS
jgi:hypothetical protein